MADHAHSTPIPRAGTAPPTASRRSLFGAVTALACSPVLPAAAVPMPDAGLIRLCAAFHEVHDAIDVILDQEHHLVRTGCRWPGATHEIVSLMTCYVRSNWSI